MESCVASRPFANLNSASFALQTATPYWTHQYTGRLRGVYRRGAAMALAFRPAPCPLLIAGGTIESATIGLAAGGKRTRVARPKTDVCRLARNVRPPLPKVVPRPREQFVFPTDYEVVSPEYPLPLVLITQLSAVKRGT